MSKQDNLTIAIVFTEQSLRGKGMSAEVQVRQRLRGRQIEKRERDTRSRQ